MKSNKLFHTVMKAKNIIYIISLVFAAMSCSMDSDTMMNDTTKEIENSLNNGEVAVSFSLTDGSVTTKSVTPAAADNTTDQDINNVTIFLLEGENVIDVKQSNVKNQKLYTNCFYVKKGERSSLNLIVVANSSIGTSFATANEIRTAVIHLGDCTKYGESALSLSGNAYTATIELIQSYAKVGLASFKVQRAASSGYNNLKVELTNIALVNQNTKGQVDGLAMVPTATELANLNVSRNDIVILNNNTGSSNILKDDVVLFNTFAYDYKNTEQKLALALTYEVNGISHTETITIQGATQGTLAVAAGNIYKLNVTASITPEGRVTILNVGFEVVDLVKREITPETFA
ncbi:MAG: hypothetical protein PARBA_02306 [Parabacteroides sp.]